MSAEWAVRLGVRNAGMIFRICIGHGHAWNFWGYIKLYVVGMVSYERGDISAYSGEDDMCVACWKESGKCFEVVLMTSWKTKA